MQKTTKKVAPACLVFQGGVSKEPLQNRTGIEIRAAQASRLFLLRLPDNSIGRIIQAKSCRRNGSGSYGLSGQAVPNPAHSPRRHAGFLRNLA